MNRRLSLRSNKSYQDLNYILSQGWMLRMKKCNGKCASLINFADASSHWLTNSHLAGSQILEYSHWLIIIFRITHLTSFTVFATFATIQCMIYSGRIFPLKISSNCKEKTTALQRHEQRGASILCLLQIATFSSRSAFCLQCDINYVSAYLVPLSVARPEQICSQVHEGSFITTFRFFEVTPRSCVAFTRIVCKRNRIPRSRIAHIFFGAPITKRRTQSSSVSLYYWSRICLLPSFSNVLPIISIASFDAETADFMCA